LEITVTERVLVMGRLAVKKLVRWYGAEKELKLRSSEAQKLRSSGVQMRCLDA
jgi:hypothetical protein